jgi:nitrate reductase beta subunit
MWWNNVETKPGTGYPTQWEDQDKYQGGWAKDGENIKLKSTGKRKIITNIFHNPHQPTMDDYYEPWTYKYEDLFNAPEGDDQPTARPISMVTGELMQIESGPNWDDDLGGSPVYAEHDPNLKGLSAEVRAQLSAVERLVFFYFPRICNHCLNPACVASCPSGALYKRGEDGIVLIDQNRCRGWRSCIAACPYKKTYYNWQTGKSEKCILCFPRLETGQAPACFHSCVGRIRYLGVLLYDADMIDEVARMPEDELVDAHRNMIMNPHDPKVIAAASANGIHDDVIKAAQKSPVYKYVIEWGLALPPHSEFRTLPMLFYVPPMLPVTSSFDGKTVKTMAEGIFPDFDKARIPMEFLANLLAAGDTGKVRYALKKQMAVRHYRRALTVGDIEMKAAMKLLVEAGSSVEEAEEIYKLTSLCTFNERFVIPPAHREEAIEMMRDPLEHKQSAGFGFREEPVRGA